jgi:hypothetical protein
MSAPNQSTPEKGVTKTSRQGASHFRRGDLVRVRSLDEIVATLDADAKLAGLPFMPEMVPCCGSTFRIFRRAEKTCVEGTGMRKMENTVFLEGLRCDGSAHDGCQRGCLFFWKEAWLEKADDEGPDSKSSALLGADYTKTTTPGSRAALLTLASGRFPTTKNDLFFCQSTELAGATSELPPGKLRHYLHDLRIGEISLGRFFYILWLALTNRVWRLLRGQGLYQITGEQKTTLTAELNLQPGELVEIKSAAEIQATLDDKGRNRGLSFEPEMALHCGRRYRVAGPVRTIIAEETGKMVKLSNTVILEGLVCQGICVMNCPRANHLYWREIWLKRVEGEERLLDFEIADVRVPQFST